MMFRSVHGRLALVLTLVLVAAGGLMMLGTQQIVATRRLIELTTDLIVGAVAFGLLPALLVFRLLARRLRTLADALDEFRDNGFSRPLALPAVADADGDEIDRIGAALREMSQRVATRLQALGEMDARRRELLANVCHELRAPLASMLGHLETLLARDAGLAPGEARSYLRVVTGHAEALSRVVDDLTELTRLEAKEVRAEPVSFHLCELAVDVMRKFERRAQRRGLRLATHYAPKLPAVSADIGLIERALGNLLDNALRHTPTGGEIHIDVSAAGERVALCVRDTGSGIAREQLGRIFDRYYRADRIAAGADGGTSLGLAIARQIVELHGGRIRVDSTPEHGTRFTFDLPAAAPARAAEPPFPCLRAASGY